MGQKVNPKGFRVGINKGWDSIWTAPDDKAFANNLYEDHKIRKHLKAKYAACAISKIIIERTNETVTVNIFTARPGIIIGQKGANVEQIKKELTKMTDKKLTLNIKEVKNPDLDATLVAESIAQQLEKRVGFRRAMKQAIQRTMRSGAKGIKTQVGGRLDGAEIARREHYQEGSLPLHTIRSNVDYGTATARTIAGAVGVKVWIYFGEILGKQKLMSTETKQEGQTHVNAKKN